MHTRALSLLSLGESRARHRTFKLLARWRGHAGGWRRKPRVQQAAELSRAAAQRPASQGPSGNSGARPGPASIQWPPGQHHAGDLRRLGRPGSPAGRPGRRRGRGGVTVPRPGCGRDTTRLPLCPSLAMGRRTSPCPPASSCQRPLCQPRPPLAAGYTAARRTCATRIVPGRP